MSPYYASVVASKRLVSLICVLAVFIGLGDGLIGAEADATKKAPKLIHTVSPQHPPDLYDKGISGKVVVQVTVDKTGAIKDAEIVSATHEDFAAPTLTAVEQWRFEPGIKNGKPAEFKVKVPFDFKISLASHLRRLTGRDVIVEIEEPIVPAKDLGYIPAPERWLAAPYPNELIGTGKSGRAIISFVISKEGMVLNPKVTKSDDNLFAVSAILAVCGLRYPVIRGEDGEAKFVHANVEYDFEDPGTDSAEVLEPEEAEPGDVAALSGQQRPD